MQTNRSVGRQTDRQTDWRDIDLQQNIPVKTSSIWMSSCWLPGGVSLASSTRAVACAPILLASPASHITCPMLLTSLHCSANVEL